MYELVYSADGSMVSRPGGREYPVDAASGLPVGPVDGGYFKIEEASVAGWLRLHYMSPGVGRWRPKDVSLGWSVLTPEADGEVSTNQVVCEAIKVLQKLGGSPEKWLGTYPPQNVQEVGNR